MASLDPRYETILHRHLCEVLAAALQIEACALRSAHRHPLPRTEHRRLLISQGLAIAALRSFLVGAEVDVASWKYPLLVG